MTEAVRTTEEVVLETERLELRRLSPRDAAFIVELLNDADFLLNIGDKGVRNETDAFRYLSEGPLASYEKHGFGLWLVSVKEEGPVGMCGLLKRDTLPDVDIGFAFLPQFRGRGYASEAATAVMRYGREALGIDRIVAIVSPGNERSINVLEKIGLRFDRTMVITPGEAAVQLFVPA
jgi:RimJ/RimL family protein N-acetyltransferase